MGKKTKENIEAGLTIKQKKFVDLYFVYDLDSVRAYTETYPKSTYAAGRASISKLLTKDKNVMEYVKYKQEQFELESKVDKTWILTRLKRYTKAYDDLIFMSNQTDLTETDLKKLKQLKSVIRASDISSFINMINKMGGFYEAEQLEVKHNWSINFGDAEDNENDEETDD